MPPGGDGFRIPIVLDFSRLDSLSIEEVKLLERVVDKLGAVPAGRSPGTG